MPPPPPPSKSYLLQFTDSDLEEDSSDDVEDSPLVWERKAVVTATTAAANANANAVTGSSNVIQKNKDNTAWEEEEEELTATTTSSTTTTSNSNSSSKSNNNNNSVADNNDNNNSNNKRTKKKKKKKKKKSKSGSAATTTTMTTTTTTTTTFTATPDTKSLVAAHVSPPPPPPPRHRRHVQFTHVQIRCFARTFYSDGVPTDGGWPLGLAVDDFEDVLPVPMPIDVYEDAKQERLQVRFRTLKTMAPDEPLPPLPLETRQWDFKFGTKNPLFRALSEKTRMQLILGLEDKEIKPSHHNNHSSSSKSSSSPTKKDTSLSSSSSSSRRTRSSSGGGGSHHHHHHHRHSQRKTSGSYHEQPQPWDSFEARQVQQELEALRTERGRQNARGCSCKKLHVYIPPPTAGRKAAHKRLKPAVLKEELRKRNALPPDAQQGTREELEHLLADLVAAEPCCSEEDCPCRVNGIECQSDACGCWKAAAHHLPASTTKPTPDEQVKRCGNPHGMVTVDFEAIDAYRERFYTCRPCHKSKYDANADDDSDQEEKKMEESG
eukprot:scaffold5783_cov129-Amphora_coffeaeformis.AAC.15